MAETDLRIRTADAIELAATLFEANTASPAGVVLINAALGVPRAYYRHFARHLMESGFHVVTYDYRGIGESRAGALRNNPAFMHEFGVHDMSAIIGWIADKYPALPILAVGHSVGGQMVGLAENNEKVKGVLTIASQWPYWRYWEGKQLWRLVFLWYVLIPGITPVLGYFPSKAFGLGEDLPKGVAWEWSRWARRPRYLFDDAARLPIDRYRNVRARFRAYSFSDDEFAPPRSVDALIEAYPHAETEHIHITPREVGVDQIGHFGFFRPHFKDHLWDETTDWLRQTALDMKSPKRGV